MSSITSKVENGILTIFASGRIDSTNAPAVEAQIEEQRSANPHTGIVLDIDALEYISSAGLRVILRLRKSEPSLKVENASSDVYEVFEITGFSEMIPITKAYRKISVEGCEVIGQGANGKVYRIDGDTIVKVYLNPDSLPDIHRERELARRAFVLGVPTAISYDVVKVGGGYGSVFEMLNAKSLGKLIRESPEKLDEYVDVYVDLLKKIHGTTVNAGEMPDMRDVVIGWANFLRDHLPADKAEKLVSLCEAVPVDYRLLHGDYHVKNIMMQNGEALLIDMDTLCHGHPVFELASIYNACIGFSELDPNITMEFLGLPQETMTAIWTKFLPRYLGTGDEAVIADVECKAMLVGYTRLLRRTIRRRDGSEAQARAIECYKNHILDLLDRVDTLVF